MSSEGIERRAHNPEDAFMKRSEHPLTPYLRPDLKVDAEPWGMLGEKDYRTYLKAIAEKYPDVPLPQLETIDPEDVLAIYMGIESEEGRRQPGRPVGEIIAEITQEDSPSDEETLGAIEDLPAPAVSSASADRNERLVPRVSGGVPHRRDERAPSQPKRRGQPTRSSTKQPEAPIWERVRDHWRRKKWWYVGGGVTVGALGAIDYVPHYMKPEQYDSIIVNGVNWASENIFHRNQGQTTIPKRPEATAVPGGAATAVLAPEATAEPTPNPIPQGKVIVDDDNTSLQGVINDIRKGTKISPLAEIEVPADCNPCDFHALVYPQNDDGKNVLPIDIGRVRVDPGSTTLFKGTKGIDVQSVFVDSPAYRHMIEQVVAASNPGENFKLRGEPVPEGGEFPEGVITAIQINGNEAWVPSAESKKLTLTREIVDPNGDNVFLALLVPFQDVTKQSVIFDRKAQQEYSPQERHALTYQRNERRIVNGKRRGKKKK